MVHVTNMDNAHIYPINVYSPVENTDLPRTPSTLKKVIKNENKNKINNNKWIREENDIRLFICYYLSYVDLWSSSRME